MHTLTHRHTNKHTHRTRARAMMPLIHWLVNALEVCSLTLSHSPISLTRARWGWLNQTSEEHTPIILHWEYTYSTEYILYRKCTIYTHWLYWECCYSTEFTHNQYIVYWECTHFTEKVPIVFIFYFYSNLKSLQTFDCVVIQYSEK